MWETEFVSVGYPKVDQTLVREGNETETAMHTKLTAIRAGGWKEECVSMSFREGQTP